MSAKKRELAKQRSADEKLARDTYNTLSRYLTIHRACRDEIIVHKGKPILAVMRDGSIMESVRRNGHLRRHQILAWHFWYSCVAAAHGSTDGMTVNYGERVDIKGISFKKLDAEWMIRHWLNEGCDIDRTIKETRPHIHITSAGSEYQQIWEFLRHEERGLLEQLTRDYYRADGQRDIHAPTLAYLGSGLSGYHDNRQSIAAGVSRIQALTNSIAQFYGIEIFLS